MTEIPLKDLFLSVPLLKECEGNRQGTGGFNRYLEEGKHIEAHHREQRWPEEVEEAAAVEARADLLGRTSENSGLRVGRHGGQRGKVYTCLGGTWKGKLGRDI